jgi:O-antigen/teichoic acid export membrane protein
MVPHVYVLAQSIAAARFLGPELLGRQSYIAFIELSVILLFSGGLPFALMRYIGETLGRGDSGPVRGLIAWAWLVEGVGALAGAAVLVAFAVLGTGPHSAWLLAGVGAAISIIHNVPSSLLAGAQLWRAASIVGLLTGLLSTGLMIAVLAAGGGITGMFAVEAAVSALNLLVTTLIAGRAMVEIAPRSAPAGTLRRDVRRYALVSSVNVFVTFIVWRRSELLFLERFSSDKEIALYSIPFAVVTAIGQLPTALGAVLSPAIATLVGARATERIRSGYERSLRLFTLLGFILTAYVIAVGPTALRVLYGEDYAGTGPVLVVLMCTFPIVPLIYLSRSLLVGLGKLRFPVVAGVVAAAVNVLLDLLLIPAHDAIGAAIANAGAQLAAGLPLLVYSARCVGRPRWRPFALARGATATALAGVATGVIASALGGAGGVAAGTLVGALAFAGLAVSLRILPADDAAWLQQIVGSRMRGLPAHAARLCAGPAL